MCFGGKTFEKKFFWYFLWQVSFNLILIWRIHLSNSFSHIFSSSSSFLPRLVKNVPKMGENFLFTDLHRNCHITQFWYGELKTRTHFPIFFIFIFIFASINQKYPKNGSKVFAHRFTSKLPYNLILIWRIHRSNSYSQIFPLTSSFLPRLVKHVLKNGSNVFFSDFHENCHIT